MSRYIATIAIAAVLFAGTASGQTREAQDHALQGYLARAGAPVDHFPYRTLQKWELVGQNRIVVWTRVNEAWLLSVDQPCSELQYTPSIALTSSARQVRKRFDYVIVGKGRERCTIMEIRPIDQTADGAGKSTS